MVIEHVCISNRYKCIIAVVITIKRMGLGILTCEFQRCCIAVDGRDMNVFMHSQAMRQCKSNASCACA